VAAVYDIHGNLPALEAVLSDLEAAEPDLIVVGGDVVAGPMPVEVLDLLSAFGGCVRFVRGNADREVVRAFDSGGASCASSDPAERSAAWVVSRLERRHRDLLAAFEERVVVEVEGLGEVLFCHGSPGSDEEILTAATPEECLLEAMVGVEQGTVVCGHTHAQFDRRAGGKRVINAGSVGMPYGGRPVGAFWLALGPGIELRRSDYDLEGTAERVRLTGYPDAEDVAEILLEPPDLAWVTSFFERQAGRG
jgi:predicted phosphodiesterase